ncbi:MAG: type II toxin-antitoxin system prevent-host-death family antitoxin [Acidobacteriaceae bacterium]
MKTMAAGAFKTHCLSVLNEVHERGEPVLVTKRGKPLARVVPVAQQEPKSALGSMKGRFEIVGNIMEPTMSDEDVTQWKRKWDDL